MGMTLYQDLIIKSERLLTGEWRPALEERREFMKRLKEAAQEATSDTIAAKPLWRVDLTTLAYMKGVMYIQADTEPEARTMAKSSIGDVSWEYDGVSETPGHGPEISNVTKA